MISFERYITVTNPDQIVVPATGLRPGERVRVIVTRDPADRESLRSEFQKLFRDTQALPGAAELTDRDIAEEVEAERRSRKP